MAINDPAYAEVLAQILLIESMVVHLPDETTIFDFVCRGLELVPGIKSVRHTTSNIDQHDHKSERYIALKMGMADYGNLHLSLSSSIDFKPYKPYIYNLCHMLALIIDQRRQRDTIIRAKQGLEEQVDIRTQQLKGEVIERKKAEQSAIAQQQRAERYLEVSEAVILELDLQGRIKVINQRGCDILGYSESELIGREWISLALPEKKQDQVLTVFTKIVSGDYIPADHYENEIITRDGQQKIIAWHNVQVLNENGVCTGILSSGQDITDRKIVERRAHHLAFYDVLTDLPNRRLMLDRLNQNMANSTRGHSYKGILFLDLDNFKDLNDNYGHDLGDRMLVETGQRIQQCVREVDTVSRLGGDEFVVLLGHLATTSEGAANNASTVAEKIMAVLQLPYIFDSLHYQSSASMGIVLFKDQRLPIDELLKRADMAMYQSKAMGKNNYNFFDSGMQERIESRRALKDDLLTAISMQEFQLYYQPQLDINNRCLGAEALIRWNSPNRGFVPPIDFISFAEDSGLIIPLGHWVLDQACKQLRIWQDSGNTRHLRLAINLSVIQFQHDGFVEEVLAAIADHKIDPTTLKIEITESIFVKDIDSTIIKINQLRNAGIGFSIDDFGTGFSSLSYVKRLPINQLKIDRSFVDDILTDPSDEAICRTIIAMGETLKLITIAEGVETVEQWEVLKKAGCNEAQGFLFARPMPIDEFTLWFEQSIIDCDPIASTES